MFLSRIFKELEFENLGSSPLVMEDLGPDGAAGMNPSGIAGASVVVGEEMERRAYELGFASGEKAGFEIGRKKAEALFSSLAGLIEGLESARRTIIEGAEKDVAALSLAIARKVVRGEITARNDVILGCVSAALEGIPAKGQVVVKVNPRDLELVTEHRRKVESRSQAGMTVSFVADASVSKGGCMVFTDFGSVDASIENVMEEIEQRLKDAY
ncbi:MAG: FliH/SctL family protein [Deltaproteobacteria bacterium]